MSTRNTNASFIVCGYMRNNYSNTIIMDLVEIIVLFYDLIYHWYFKHDTFNKLLNGQRGDRFDSKPFEINAIRLKYSLIHHGNSIECALNIDYSDIDIDEYLPNVEYLGIEAQFLCLETGSKYHCSERITRADIIRGNTVKECEMKQKISTIQLLNSLSFDCIADIKYIKYSQEANKKNYNILQPLNVNGKYEWKIDGELLEILKNKNKKSDNIYSFCDIKSQRFDNNWYFAAEIDVDDDTQNPKLYIWIVPLLLPLDVYGIAVQMEVANNIKNTIISNDVCEFFESKTIMRMETGLCLKHIITESCIVFNIEFEVTHIWNTDMDDICEYKKWKEYGFIIQESQT